jgi:hypothetical protein
MTLGEFRSATRDTPDTTEIVVFNHWDCMGTGEIEDLDIGPGEVPGSPPQAQVVTIKTTIRHDC